MTASDCEQCRHCAQWTHGSTWTDRAQIGMEMNVSGIMAVAMARIMERLTHRMDEKVQQLRLRPLKDKKHSPRE